MWVGKDMEPVTFGAGCVWLAGLAAGELATPVVYVSDENGGLMVKILGPWESQRGQGSPWNIRPSHAVCRVFLVTIFLPCSYPSGAQG